MLKMSLLNLLQRCVLVILRFAIRAALSLHHQLVASQQSALNGRQGVFTFLNRRAFSTWTNLSLIPRPFFNSLRNLRTSLCIFTGESHRLILELALLLEVASGAIFPLFAVILGRSFKTYAEYGTGNINEDAFFDRIADTSKLLLVFAGSSWLLHAVAYILSHIFGEIQVGKANERVFGALLRKEQGWFDTRENGLRALLYGIQG